MRLPKIIPAVLALAFATSISAAPAPAHIDIQLSHQLDEERAERLEKFVERFNTQQKDVTLKLVHRVEGDAPKQINLVTRDEQSRFVASRGSSNPCTRSCVMRRNPSTAPSYRRSCALA